MEKLLEQLSEHFGFAAPLMYAAAAYALFHWLDENTSDEAKAALARTMRFKDYKKEQVASALVEVFDRIYTHPLLRWRAFFRSLLFTTVVSAIFVFEAYHYGFFVRPIDWGRFVLLGLLFNVLSDYLSLFVIRPVLIRSGTKPVIGLALGTVTGAAIVLAVDTLRRIVLTLRHYIIHPLLFAKYDDYDLIYLSAWVWQLHDLIFAWPAMAVFVWLLLFASVLPRAGAV
jgi:hypothetical protein